MVLKMDLEQDWEEVVINNGQSGGRLGLKPAFVII